MKVSWDPEKKTAIMSPWLRMEEAARYCGISYKVFASRTGRLPHGGTSRMRIYHIKVLDRWINNEIPDLPFALAKKEETQEQREPRRRRRPARGEPTTLVHPQTGKVYR